MGAGKSARSPLLLRSALGCDMVVLLIVVPGGIKARPGMGIGGPGSGVGGEDMVLVGFFC